MRELSPEPERAPGANHAIGHSMRPSQSEARRTRERLEARRRELLVRYKNTLDQAEAELADDSRELVDVAHDQWDARVLAVMTERDALALENIVAALHRLDTGRYGRCIRCGDKISAARLGILPEIGHCLACAAFTEKRRRARAFAS
jgi:DnaK suppressor protein